MCQKVNNKGFLELDEINPAVVLLALAAGLVAFIVGSKAGYGGLWNLIQSAIAVVIAFIGLTIMSNNS